VPEVVQQDPAVTLPPSTPAAPPKRFELKEEPEAPAASPPPAEPAKAPEAKTQNTGDEATPATPEAKPEQEEVTPEQAAKREGRRFERRLDKAYRQRAEALARAELLEKRLAEIETRIAAPKAVEGEPKLEQFDYDPEKYAAAKAEFAKTQAQKEFEARQRESQEKQARQKLLADWEEKAERALDKYEDFNDLVGNLEPNNPLITAIMEADNGEDIAYHLAKNPKEAQRLLKLSPTSQLREIGKLEAKLASKPVELKAPSKAPAPITPLTGQAPVVTDTPSDEDDTATWIRKRTKQVHGRR